MVCFQSAQSPLLSTSLVHALGVENAFCLWKQRLKACPPLALSQGMLGLPL